MRSFLIASAGLVLAGTGTADAQQGIGPRPGASYGVPGTAMQPPMAQPRQPAPIAARPPIVRTTSYQGAHRSPRWGSKIGGRWWGGANAPGGWAGYRRPYRGWAIPTYWNAPRFYVSDWSSYGLAQPPHGYNWTRYYDDAVLIDARGSVYDTTSGIDWDRPDAIYADAGYPDAANPDVAYRPDHGRADYATDYAQDDAVYAGPDERGYTPRDGGRDSGLGGAAIGAVAGGVAGNVIAGRGNRLGGTLIGAGIGAAAGYAIDKNEDRGRRLPPPPPLSSGSTGYDARYGAGYAPPPVPAYGRAQPGSWVSPDGLTTVTTSGGGYQSGSTTVVVQSAPVVTTTTTTEYYDEAVTYRPRKVWKKRT